MANSTELKRTLEKRWNYIRAIDEKNRKYK